MANHGCDDRHNAVLSYMPCTYNLANFLRLLALPEEVAQWSLTTLREKLVKIGAWFVRHVASPDFSVRPEARVHQWRKYPPSELSVELVAGSGLSG